MNRLVLAVAAVSVALFACGGGGTTVRIYKGTSTITQISGGASGTQTVTGDYQLVSSSGTDPSKWLIEGGGTSLTATLSGTNLNFVGGPIYSVMQGNASQSLSLSNGTGSMTNEQLTLNLTLSQTTTQGNSSFTVAYNGTRE